MCTKDFVAKDGRIYQIELSYDGETITVFFENEKFGSISLMQCEGVGYDDCYFYIINLDLQNCKRLGIGTASLQYHIEIFERPIVAASINGPRMEDGSHLIDDGIPFITKMRSLGIVAPEPSEFIDNLEIDDY